MAETEAVKKPAVNPLLIIVLVAALGGAAYMQFFMKPAPEPPRKPVTSPSANTNTAVTPAELIAKTTAATTPATPEPNVKSTEPVLSERDPFRVPFSSRGSTTNTNTNTNSGSSGQNLSYSDEPLWKGTIKTNDGQVAIISYHGKSYLLRIGDQLSDSNYRLSEINQDSILLTSPKKPLRLRKNEEAK